jgi:hypothetical protein
MVYLICLLIFTVLYLLGYYKFPKIKQKYTHIPPEIISNIFEFTGSYEDTRKLRGINRDCRDAHTLLQIPYTYSMKIMCLHKDTQHTSVKWLVDNIKKVQDYQLIALDLTSWDKKRPRDWYLRTVLFRIGYNIDKHVWKRMVFNIFKKNSDDMTQELNVYCNHTDLISKNDVKILKKTLKKGTLEYYYGCFQACFHMNEKEFKQIIGQN